MIFPHRLFGGEDLPIEVLRKSLREKQIYPGFIGMEFDRAAGFPAEMHQDICGNKTPMPVSEPAFICCIVTVVFILPSSEK